MKNYERWIGAKNQTARKKNGAICSDPQIALEVGKKNPE
jgi:hypothetical protein